MVSTTELSGRNFIGARQTSEGSERLFATDRTTGARIDTPYFLSTPDERRSAAHLASEAFALFRQVSPEERATFLEAIATQIEDMGESLIEMAHRETALPEARLIGERGRTVGQLRMFAALIREGSWVEAYLDSAQPDRAPLPKPDLRRMLSPLGPVVVFGASNFPFAYSVAGGDTASALAAGCPVIVKAHPAHPGTSERVARAILRAADEARMPDGVFSMLHADEQGSQELVRLPQIAAVGFTGSKRGGRALFDACSGRERPIPCFAEMGSVNPVFLLPGAMSERGASIAENYFASVTLGLGQFCTNPGLVIGIGGKDLAAFFRAVEEKMRDAGPGPMLTEGICEAYRTGSERLYGKDGVRLEAKGAAPLGEEGNPALFSVSGEAFLESPELAEEVFGPCGLAVVCKDLAEMELVAQSLDGQLTASVHLAGSDEPQRLVSILREVAGRLVFNGFPTGVEVCPSMQHGGPYPASTDSRFGSVGATAIARFARPVCYQNAPQDLLPAELKDGNPHGIWRTVDGKLTQD